MSEYTNHASGRPPQGRGRGGRRRSSSSSPARGNSSRGGFRPNRKQPEPTGFQKFLTAITFGLYKPQVMTFNTPAPRDRAPREEGPIARGDRQNRESTRREGRSSRQLPASTEATSERLYVGNLSYDATESDLSELFSGSGRVKTAEVVVNNRTQRSKGFAFVTMLSVDEAKKAVTDLNGKDFMGRPLVVGGAKPLQPDEQRQPRQHQDEETSDITRPEEDLEESEPSRI